MSSTDKQNIQEEKMNEDDNRSDIDEYYTVKNAMFPNSSQEIPQDISKTNEISEKTAASEKDNFIQENYIPENNQQETYYQEEYVQEYIVNPDQDPDAELYTYEPNMYHDMNNQHEDSRMYSMPESKAYSIPKTDKYSMPETRYYNCDSNRDSINDREEDYYINKLAEKNKMSKSLKSNSDFDEISEASLGPALTENGLQGKFSIKNVIDFYRKTSNIYSDDYKVEVSEPKEVGYIWNKVQYYDLTGFCHFGTFSVTRRYTDFLMLHFMLTVNYPGTFIPSISEKNPILKYNKEFILERRLFLENFLLRLLKSKTLGKSKEIINFLTLTDRNHYFFHFKFSNFEDYYWTKRVEEILAFAKKEYGEGIIEEIDPNMVEKLRTYKVKLEKLKDQLVSWRYNTEKLIMAQMQLKTASKAFVQSAEGVENVIKELKGIQDLAVFHTNEYSNMVDKQVFENAVECFKLLLKLEIRDFESMIKTISDVLLIYNCSVKHLNKQLSIQKLIDNAERVDNPSQERVLSNLRADLEKASLSYSNYRNIANIAMNVMYNYESQYFWVEKNERLMYINKLLTLEFKNYHNKFHDYYFNVNERLKEFYDRVVSEEKDKNS